MFKFICKLSDGEFSIENHLAFFVFVYLALIFGNPFMWTADTLTYLLGDSLGFIVWMFTVFGLIGLILMSFQGYWSAAEKRVTVGGDGKVHGLGVAMWAAGVMFFVVGSYVGYYLEVLI